MEALEDEHHRLFFLYWAAVDKKIADPTATIWVAGGKRPTKERDPSFGVPNHGKRINPAGQTP